MALAEARKEAHLVREVERALDVAELERRLAHVVRSIERIVNLYSSHSARIQKLQKVIEIGLFLHLPWHSNVHSIVLRVEVPIHVQEHMEQFA